MTWAFVVSMRGIEMQGEMNAATADTRTSPTPLLDRLNPLPSPIPPGSGSRNIVGVWIGVVITISAILMSWDPPFARSLRLEIFTHFEQMLAGDFVLGSVSGGLIELLPIRSGAVAFDGWRILRLLQNRQWSDRWLALMSLSADLQDGIMPEALSAHDLAEGHRDMLLRGVQRWKSELFIER